ncbi:MAG: hypothetical protein ABGY41_01555, partial [Candidatus Poribacteria bacterium]
MSLWRQVSDRWQGRSTALVIAVVAIGFSVIALEMPMPGPLAAVLPATDAGWSGVVWSSALIGGGAAAVLIIPSRSPVWIGALLVLCLTVAACALLTGG